MFWIFYVSANDLGLVSEHVAGAGFDNLPPNKHNMEDGERERLAHTGPKGWACLSLAEPDMKYITSIYLTKDPKAKHQRNSKVTDYTRSMKRFHDVRHLKQTTENEKHLEAFKESQSASVPNKTNRTAFLIAWVEVHRVCRSSLAHERMFGVCCSLLC